MPRVILKRLVSKIAEFRHVVGNFIQHIMNVAMMEKGPKTVK